MACLHCESTVSVPPDHPCLAGHFPDRPIVPAVLLLDLVIEAAAALLGEGRRPRQLSSAKFLRPVAPRERIVIRLETDDAGQRLRFRCLVDDRLAAQGEWIVR